MPKIHKYKIYANQFAKGQLVNSTQIEGVFTTTQAFEYLWLQHVQLPQTLHVFRNTLHLFFEEMSQFDYEEAEAKKHFVPKNFTDKRNYTGFALALADKQ